jgi:beta-phosphoglucomutase
LPSENGAAPRRVLILDFDGVVVDTERVHFESWKAALAETVGAHLSGDYRQIVGLTLDELYAMWIAEGVVRADTLNSETKDLLLARKTDYFFEIGADQLAPVAGVADLVRRAQDAGWYVAIASRGRRIRLLRTLEIARVPAIFELVLCSEDIVDPATDRKVHSRAAHALGAEPEDCVVVEDSTAGVLDARDSGAGWVVGLTTSVDAEELYAAGADVVVDSLAQIILPPPARVE